MGNSTNPKFRIRQCEDLQLLKSLCVEIFDYDYIDNHSVFWVVYCGDQAVGLCSCRMFRYHPDVCLFTLAGLIRRARGFGLHKRMIDVRLRWARKRGMVRAVTYTMIDNTISAMSLIRAGFTLYRPSWEWQGDEVMYLKKEL